MASLPFLSPTQVILAAPMTADIFSTPSNLLQVACCSYTVVWTGTPNGTFLVEVCNDYVPANSLNSKPVNAGNWSPVTLSSSIAATGAPGAANINVPFRGFAFVRLHYVFSSSTGSLTATVAGKQAS